MRPRSGSAALPARPGEKVSSYDSGRVCSDPECVTVLSKYNGSSFCSLHEPRTFRQSGVRR